MLQVENANMRYSFWPIISANGNRSRWKYNFFTPPRRLEQTFEPEGLVQNSKNMYRPGYTIKNNDE